MTTKKAPLKRAEEELPPKMKIRGKMSPEQYWKWRLTIEEMSHAKTRANESHLKAQLKVLELEKNNLQLIMARKDYQEKTRLIEEAKVEYDSVKNSIEKELGVQFDGCAINPHTFEIQELNENR